jgi:hypothetical protein
MCRSYLEDEEVLRFNPDANVLQLFLVSAELDTTAVDVIGTHALAVQRALEHGHHV